MINKKFKIFSFLTLFLILPNFIFAAPNISGVIGAFTHDNTVTVNGNGFGVKNSIAPILWETFDDGINGLYLSSIDSAWTPYLGSGGAVYSDTIPHSGGLCVYNRVAYGESDQEFNTNNYHFIQSDEIYYSYYFRHDGTNVEDAVQKLGRINTTGNLYNGPGVIALSDGYVYYDNGVTSVYPSADEGSGRYFLESNLGSSLWTRHQIYGSLSNPAGSSNGYIQVSVGDETKTFANVVNRSSDFSFQYDNIILGLMFANISGFPGAYHDMYIDDVYIDNTRARVEICNASTKDGSNHCEIQIPETTWNNNQLQIKVNQGSFADNSSAYLYVLDASGIANVSGYPIIFSSGSSDTTAPDAPSGLSVL